MKKQFWEQKGLYSGAIAIMMGSGFGLIGYSLGSDHGLRAAFVLTLFFASFGAPIGYGCGLATVYSCKAIAAKKSANSPI
jgi:hypothetical protein